MARRVVQHRWPQTLSSVVDGDADGLFPAEADRQLQSSANVASARAVRARMGSNLLGFLATPTRGLQSSTTLSLPEKSDSVKGSNAASGPPVRPPHQ